MGVTTCRRILVVAAPARSRGCAEVGTVEREGRVIVIAMAPPSRFSLRRLARLFEHEVTHTRGQEHEAMSHDVLWSLGPVPRWARGARLRYRGRAPRQLGLLEGETNAMRTRGRFRRRFHEPARTRRDTDTLAPISVRTTRPPPSTVTREVPLPQFRREVVALLVATSRKGGYGRKLDSDQALRLAVKWDKMLRLRHGQGKPPCNVSDHILKFEQHGDVCPCGAPAPVERDRERSRHRFSSSPSSNARCPRCGRRAARPLLRAARCR